MKIFYWSPHISEVATIYAVINSAKSLKRYSKTINPIIINAVGEWNDYLTELEKENIEIINLLPFSIYNKLPRYNYIKSRFSYFLIFLISLFPLFNLLRKEKPEYLMCHLISSLPIFLFNIFNFKTKLILRISGLPKLNFIRKIYWKISSKNIYKIFCPTNFTKKKLVEENIFSNEKLNFLPDPILEIKKYMKKKNHDNDLPYNKEKIILGIGRLTKQKNFSFLIECFSKIKNKFKSENYKLVIVGEGEERNKLLKLIKNLNLEKEVMLVGYEENVYKYLKIAECFVLSSLWEDPGFVLIESFISSTPVISSNCESGPIDLIYHLKNGLIFESNNHNSFLKTFDEFKSLNTDLLKKIRLNGKKMSKKYTIFSHFNYLNDLLSS